MNTTFELVRNLMDENETLRQEVARLTRLAGIVENIWEDSIVGPNQIACGYCRRKWANCGHTHCLWSSGIVNDREVDICTECGDAHFSRCPSGDNNYPKGDVEVCRELCKQYGGCEFISECEEGE